MKSELQAREALKSLYGSGNGKSSWARGYMAALKWVLE